MTLIRTAFWLSLVVLLLPTDAQQQEKLYKTASDAASQAATFCDRNGKICSKGSEYWGTFQRKLEFGSRLAVDLASERLLGRSRQANAAIPAHSAAGGLAPVGHALTPSDLAPAWRSVQGRSGI